MPEQNLEYDQHAPQNGGRLFSNAMFGFNKEEVLEYLEELADENYQRQEAAEMQIQELTKRIKNYEAMGVGHSATNTAELNSLRSQLHEASISLEVAKTATQQTEDDLQQFREDLNNAQQENLWLREEFQKSDSVIAELRRQLDSVSGGQWNEAQEEIAALRSQLDESKENELTLQGELAELQETETEIRNHIEALQDTETDLRQKLEDALVENEDWDEDEDEIGARRTASSIIEEATLEAERIRAEARAEKDRIHRQIRSSANGLADSITNLRGDISTVEGDVGTVLEEMQLALAEVLGSLGRTEQNLHTLGVQVERFPAISPSVPAPQQPASYFQPATRPRQQAPAQVTPPNASLRYPRNENVRSFRPSYSSSQTAPAPYWSAHPVETDYPKINEDISSDARLRGLSESLVETLIQMMS